jgi:hypothetical protein
MIEDAGRDSATLREDVNKAIEVRQIWIGQLWSQFLVYDQDDISKPDLTPEDWITNRQLRAAFENEIWILKCLRDGIDEYVMHHEESTKSVESLRTNIEHDLVAPTTSTAPITPQRTSHAESTKQDTPHKPSVSLITPEHVAVAFQGNNRSLGNSLLTSGFDTDGQPVASSDTGVLMMEKFVTEDSEDDPSEKSMSIDDN